jgi:nuclear transport factor 2 (NTF2) superfamily protein
MARQSEEIASLKSQLDYQRGKNVELAQSRDHFKNYTEKMIEGQMTDVEKLGIAWAKESDSEQAKFLNAAGSEMKSWGVADPGIQVMYAHDYLDENGKWIIDEFSGWNRYREEESSETSQ